MIRKNEINCKLILESRSGKTIFDSCTGRICPEIETCPCCGCTGGCFVLAYYDRQLIDFVDGCVKSSSLCVCRLLCGQCGTSHAVLPDPIIPYSRHSLFFILHVLAEHALHIRPVERICEIFEISEKTFYRWQSLFECHRLEWQGLLLSVEEDLKAFLIRLVHKEPFSDFASAFFKKTAFSFLQSHKNPSRSPQRVKSKSSDFP